MKLQLPHRGAGKLGLCGVLVVVIAAVAPAVASAQTLTNSCRASAVRGPTIGEPVVANPQYTPCATDQNSVPRGGIIVPGLAGVYVLDARTGSGVNPLTDEPQAHGWAWASVAYAVVTLPGLTVKAWALSSTAGSKCLGPSNPDLGGYSSIAAVAVNNTFIPVSAPNTAIPIPLIGTLWINYGLNDGNQALTRAIWLDRPGGDANDIVVAEAKATRGAPC